MSVALTVFQVAWSTAWGTLHVRIRKGRGYARAREAVGSRDDWYRRLHPVLFVAQLALSVACFWSDAPWLLELHNNVPLRLVGAVLLSAALLLTLAALRHLGDNYSPCYDSHLPGTLVTSGPYSIIRHPMYLAKLLAGAGTLLLSGSVWLAPCTLYLFAATLRATRSEDVQLLLRQLPGYPQYAARTPRLIPYVL
jgi:protein-S-isoprenylcysteine O-methyltransferase Ste14